MNSDLRKKYNYLIVTLKSYEKAAVAFSGGVDSTFLAKVACDALGKKAVAITVDSAAYPPESIVETRNLAGIIGIRLIGIPIKVTDILI